MTTTYGLSGHLDSAAASPLAADLLEFRGQSICVDASAVTFAGTLSLQVLVAARRQWTEDGQDFQLAPLSHALASAAGGLGVELSEIGATQTDVIEMEATV